MTPQSLLEGIVLGECTKLSIPEEGLSIDNLLLELEVRASMDTPYKSGMIFNTECCDPHPIAVKAYSMFMDRNMMKEQNPSVNKMEIEVIQMLSDLFGSEDTSGFNGYVASGGTEANIVAFWAAKQRNPNKDTIIAPRHAHYSKSKMELLLGLRVIEVPVSDDYKVIPADIESIVDERTLGIFATAGTSRLGVIDPIPELADIASRYNLHLHIDAAYGGYLIPFMADLDYGAPDIGFKQGVSSITLDPHKFGLCPLGAGVILFNDKSYLDSISYQADFPKINNRTLQGSRSGGPVAATWTMLKYFGKEGYTNLVKSLLTKRDYLMSEIEEKIPQIKYVTQPDLTALGLTYQRDGALTRELHIRMKKRGFMITPDKNPNSLRIIIHNHVQYEHMDNLVSNLREVCLNLEKQYGHLAA